MDEIQKIIKEQQDKTAQYFSHTEEDIKDQSIAESYVSQMAKKHAMEIDKNFWLVVNEKPKWMPRFIYKAVIKNLVEFHQYK